MNLAIQFHQSDAVLATGSVTTSLPVAEADKGPATNHSLPDWFVEKADLFCEHDVSRDALWRTKQARPVKGRARL